jgi:ATP-dependent DNA helicase RecQ
LIALGYLEVDIDGYGVLRLTEKARPLLKGDCQLQLRKRSRSTSTGRSHGKAVNTVRDIDRELFDALRDKRSQLARQLGVPAYVIFHDKTLAEMARLRPQQLHELDSISGIGDRKRRQERSCITLDGSR